MGNWNTTRTDRLMSPLVLFVAIGIMAFSSQPAFAVQENEEPFVFVLEDQPPNLVGVTSQIEAGAAFITEDSFKFGDFTGLDDKGLEFLGNFDIGRRSQYDADRAIHWRLRGTNLGLASRSADVEVAEQGRFGLELAFLDIPRLTSDSAQGFYLGRGESTLRLPSGWVGATSPQGMTSLSSSLRDMRLDHDRKRARAEMFWIPAEGWRLNAQFQRERKEGTRLTAGLIGATGGNPRSVLVPEPVNFETNQWNASIQYATPRAQLEVGYYLSAFDNREDSLTWENPYTNIGGWDPAVGFGLPGLQEGRKALAPDNFFHQATLAGGYNLLPSTRVTLDVALGRMRQDENFLSYTVNPALAVSTPLPRSSLDGEIDTTYVNLGIVSRPIRRLTLRARYRYDDRDNDTPRDTYIYVRGDAAAQGDITSGQARVNRPYSYKSNELTVSAGYRLPARTDLTLEYQRETIERDFSEVDKTRENAYTAKLRTSPAEFLTAGLTAGIADRDASDYTHNAGFLVGFSPEHIAAELAALSPTATLGDVFEEHPALQRFFLADRSRSQVAAFVTVTPLETLDISLRAQENRDRFGDPANYVGEFGDLTGLELGLRKRKARNYTLDVSYSPVEWATAHAFYTAEALKSDQDGWSFRGSARIADLAVGSGRNWTARERDAVDTWGIGGQLRGLRDRLKVDVDYSFSRTKGDVDVIAGSGLPVSSALPTALVRLHTLRADVAYDLADRFTLKLGYLFEKLTSRDWSVDGVEPGSLTQVVTTGEDSPDYRAHVFWLSVVYKFWL